MSIKKLNKFSFLINSISDVADECDKRGCYEESEKLTGVLEVLSSFADMTKTAYIKKIQKDNATKYEVKSEDNDDWSGGVFDTKEEAEKRLRQVEFFKHNK